MKNLGKIRKINLYFLSVQNAINWFENARSPGIKKQNYLERLEKKFGINSLKSTQIQAVKFSFLRKILYYFFKIFQGIIPTFAVNHPNIVPIVSEPLLQYIRSKCQKMCESNG